MARLNIPPTRSNLIRVKQELNFAREGYEILNRKREVLTGELIQMAHDAETVQREVWGLLERAYEALDTAQLTMGREKVEWAALAVRKNMEVTLRFRGIMGVAIPDIEQHGNPDKMVYSPGETSAALDEASFDFRAVMERIPELSRMMTAVWRLANELRKTQRRVNALQHVFIPDYEETVAFIIATLEEREREDTFRLKLLKSQAARKQEA